MAVQLQHCGKQRPRLGRVSPVTGCIMSIVIFLLLALQPLAAQTDKHQRRLHDWNRSDLPDTTRLKAVNALIRKSYWNTDLDSVRYYISQQHELANRIRDRHWIARAAENIGYLEYRQGDYLASQESLRRALDIYERQRDWRRMAETTRILANNYRKTGKVSEALEALQRGLLYAERLGKEGNPSRGVLLNSLGSLYLSQEDYFRARDFYEQSLAVHRQLGKESHIAANLNNLSKVLTAEGDYALATRYLDESLEIKYRRQDLEGIANSFKNKGDIFLLWNRQDSARSNYQRAMTLQDSLGLREDYASIVADLGLVALAEEQWALARDHCDRSRRLAAEIGNPQIGVKAGECLYRAYRGLADYEQSLVALERTVILQDSFLSAENTRELKELEIDYLRERTELEYLLSDRRKTEKRTWRNRIKLGLLFLAFILGWTLALTWWKRRHKPDPAQKIIEQPAPAADPPPVSATFPAEVPAPEPWITELETAIQTGLEQRIELTAGSLAARLYLSERQLLRRIKDCCGLTTQQYLLDARLRYAEDLLKNRSFQSVKEIAGTVGFSNASYFSRQFIKKFGKKPSDYLA